MTQTLTLSRRQLLSTVRKSLPSHLVVTRPHKDRRVESRASAKVRLRAEAGRGW